MPGRGGERRHDADRRRDHERAGAGDHQEDERPVEPVAPRRAEQHGGSTKIASASAITAGGTHGRTSRPTARPRRLCAPSTMRVMRASVVSSASVLSTSSAPSPLMVPANTSPPGSLATGTLAGDRRLVDRADPGRSGVERDALARPDDEPRADRRLRRRDLPLLAGGRQGAHGRRGQVEQRRDRAACPADAPALEGERQREQKATVAASNHSRCRSRPRPRSPSGG